MSNMRRMRPRTPRKGAHIGSRLLVSLSVSLLRLAPLGAQQSSQQPAQQQARDSIARQARSLEKVTVTAIRGGQSAPISAKMIDQAQIEQRYFGQDVPI